MVRSLKQSAFLERLRILMRVKGAPQKLSRRTSPYLQCNAERIGCISCAVCDWRNIAITLIDELGSPDDDARQRHGQSAGLMPMCDRRLENRHGRGRWLESIRHYDY